MGAPATANACPGASVAARPVLSRSRGNRSPSPPRQPRRQCQPPTQSKARSPARLHGHQRQHKGVKHQPVLLDEAVPVVAWHARERGVELGLSHAVPARSGQRQLPPRPNRRRANQPRPHSAASRLCRCQWSRLGRPARLRRQPTVPGVGTASSRRKHRLLPPRQLPSHRRSQHRHRHRRQPQRLPQRASHQQEPRRQARVRRRERPPSSTASPRPLSRRQMPRPASRDARRSTPSVRSVVAAVTARRSHACVPARPTRGSGA